MTNFYCILTLAVQKIEILNTESLEMHRNLQIANNFFYKLLSSGLKKTVPLRPPSCFRNNYCLFLETIFQGNRTMPILWETAQWIANREQDPERSVRSKSGGLTHQLRDLMFFEFKFGISQMTNTVSLAKSGIDISNMQIPRKFYSFNLWTPESR